jgi:ketosteroid isomerase-like protein
MPAGGRSGDGHSKIAGGNNEDSVFTYPCGVGNPLCCASPRPEQSTVDPEVRQQIEAALMKYEEAYNKSDAAGTAALYSQDAIAVLSWGSAGGATFGQQAIEKKAAAEFASSPAKQSFKLVQVYAIGNDMCAIAEFTHYHMHGKGHIVLIYVRDADSWKIRMDYWN